MMRTSDVTDLSSLLTDADWLRPLAFRLAGPDDADDALQHAWVVHRTHAAGVRDPRSWFGAVFANFARRRRRDEARRAQHERAHAAERATTAPAVDELVARMELQRRVAEAVLALAEPYRSTVLAHCLEGRTTKEIAEATGEPWATVRSRLARGVEQLRESLRRERADWRDGLAFAVFGVPSARLRKAPGVATAAVAAGVLAVSFATGVAAWLAWPSAPEAPRAPEPAVASVAADAQPRAARDERIAAGGADPVVLAEPPPPVRTVDYAGQLLDPRGEPLAGVGVIVDAQRVATTDDSGRFTARLLAGEHRITTDEAHCVLWAAPLREGAPNRFLVARRIRIAGTVVDDAGQRVANATVVYRAGTPVDFPHPLHELSPCPEPRPVEARAGEFEIDVPWLDGASLAASADGHDAGFSVRFGAPEEQSVSWGVAGGESLAITEPQEIPSFRPQAKVRFVLRRRVERGEAWRTWVIEGLVLDGEGRPVAGAAVGFGGACVSSRTDGTFTIDTKVSNLWGDAVVASHPELGVAAVGDLATRWQGETGKNPHETLRLAKATSSLRGRVVDARGEPIADRRVRIVDPWVSALGGGLRIHEEAAFRPGASTDASGRFALAELLPREHRLAVLDPTTLHCVECGSFATGSTDVVLTVEAPANLQPEWRGLVLDAAGRPIVGATVKTALWAALGRLGSSVVHEKSFVTGADGRVVVPPQCGDGVTVTIDAPGFVTAARPRSELHEPAIQLGRVAYLRYLGNNAPESMNQRRIELLDAHDRPLVVEGPYAGMWWRSTTHYLTGPRSGVLAVSELATTLVVYTDDGSDRRNEPHRHAIRLVAGEVTTID